MDRLTRYLEVLIESTDGVSEVRRISRRVPAAGRRRIRWIGEIWVPYHGLLEEVVGDLAREPGSRGISRASRAELHETYSSPSRERNILRSPSTPQYARAPVA